MAGCQAGLGRVKANLGSRVKKGAMSQAAADKALGLLKGTLDYNDYKSVAMVGPLNILAWMSARSSMNGGQAAHHCHIIGAQW